MSEPRLLPLTFAALLFLPLPSVARAQLQPTTWTETATSVTNTLTDDDNGSDDALPENLSTGLNGSTWTLASSVTYPPSGPPQVTVTAQGSYTSGSLTYFLTSASSSVAFEIQVKQTNSPPVAVSMVPVTITTQGSVGVSGNVQMYPYANASVVVYQNATFLVNEMIYASLGGPTSDSFNVTNTAMFPPGAPLSGTMQVIANVAAEGSPTAGTSAIATAMVDPAFAVADQIIPGTSSSYRDYFEIEYGAGFWELNNTPVEHTTTWGRIKRMY